MLSSLVERLNDRRRADAETGEDSGFTLIELMVVLLIMAILLAIAIPTFLGVKGGAQDRAAQSDLNTTLTNAKALYGNDQSYGTTAVAIQASLAGAEKALTFAALPALTSGAIAVPATAAPGNIYVDVNTDGNSIMMINQSQSGSCWGILTNESNTVGAAGNVDATWPVTSGAGTWYMSEKGSSGSCPIPTTVGTVTGTWVPNAFPAAPTGQ